MSEYPELKMDREEEVEKQVRRDNASQAPVSVFTSPVPSSVSISQSFSAPKKTFVANPGLDSILFTLSTRHGVMKEVAAGWLRELFGEKEA